MILKNLKMKVLTQWTYKFQPNQQYKSELPNMALPDESYSLRDLQEKYTRGTISNVVMDGKYDDDESPLEAPLTPDRLNLTDPVDVERQKQVIDGYIESVNQEVTEKLNKAAKKQEAKATSQNATTTNDDANKDEALPS